MLSIAAQTRMLTEQATAVRRAVLAPEQLAGWVPVACAEVAAFLYHRGITPTGYPFARSHPLLDGLVGVEAGFPVAHPISPHDLIEASVLPGGPAVVVMHTGPEEKIELAYQEVDDWLQSEKASASDDGWQIYHDLPTCDHVHRRIEVVQPISLAGATV